MSEFVARQVFRFFRAWGTFLNCVVLRCVFLGPWVIPSKIISYPTGYTQPNLGESILNLT